MALWDTDDNKLSGFKHYDLGPRCYESHPSLKLGKGIVYGGSASHPVKKADIYVSLQDGSTSKAMSDPWEPQAVIEVQFNISDMQAPTNVPRFLKMIDWLCNQLHDGKKVHVGCHGGHGRTGLVLSALVAKMLETKDAIQYVRTHYCKKAVESTEQVAFLRKHYGVSKVDPAKSWKPSKGQVAQIGSGKRLEPDMPLWGPAMRKEPLPKQLMKATTADQKTYVPMASARCLWKRPK